MQVIEGLYYSKDHEWVKLDGEFALIGITDYAQNWLGDIAYIEMPGIDDEFNAGDTFGTIESVKAASDIYMPVSGKVVGINDDAESDPAVINQNAYDSWLIKVCLKDQSELNGLMTASQYAAFAKQE